MQESLDREKKVRADVEKVKRKLETDLKATQEAVEELDRIKKELEDTVRRSATSFDLLLPQSLVVTTFVVTAVTRGCFGCMNTPPKFQGKI